MTPEFEREQVQNEHDTLPKGQGFPFRRRALQEPNHEDDVDRDLDAVLYPPSTVPPVAIPEHQPFSEMNCELSAHMGLPAIVVPVGFTDDGFTVGVELLGREFAEPRLFELAYNFERATDHRRLPERFGTPEGA